jgi:hypothetical protein
MSEEECTGVNSRFLIQGCFILPLRIEMVRSMKSVLWDQVVNSTEFKFRVFILS